MAHRNRVAAPRKTGHSSSAQSVMTVSTAFGGISATGLDRCARASMPISASTVTASARTLVGREPADQTLVPAGASERAIASAI
jgi:hypothetical protein